MSVGITITKSDLDQRFGTQALIVLQVMQQWVTLKTLIDSLTDQQLADLGYGTDDIALIRSATADAGTIVAVFTGQATLNTPYDFRQHIKHMAGLGY